MANTKAGYIAIIGRPNAGKSTLMNSILGAKLSIVTPKPQTTRKRVLGIHSEDDVQIVFLDTPGIISPKYELQKAMMNYVAEAIEEADIVAVIADAEDFQKKGEILHGFILEEIKRSGKPAILLINKTDLMNDKKELLPLFTKAHEMDIFKDIIPVSALRKDNLSDFLNTAKKYLPEGPFFYDPEILSSQPQRFFVSELIRERVFLEYRDEIPYSTEVNIIEFHEREHGKWHIHAEIIIEKQSQKGIVIGEKGSKLKRVGESSRKLIEEHLGCPVYLQLFVKVRENWRRNRNMLRSFGY